jgi:hypothetical protein
MKLKSYTLIPFFAICSLVRADEPAPTYLTGLLQSVGDNLWWVYPQEIEGQTVTPPKGGYIYRYKIDMNGDGSQEVFLSNSSDVAKDGEAWTIYQSDGSGGFVKIKDDFFISNSLRVKTDGGIKKYSFLTPSAEQEEIITFWLDGASGFQSSTRQLTEEESKAISGGDPALLGTDGLPDDDKIAQYLNIGDPVALNIQKVLVGKLYQSPTASWRVVNNTFSLSQQYLDPADAADIASLVSWTPPSDP